MREQLSRPDAAARGLTNYYTGKPCGRGHIAERNVKGKHCIECRALAITQRERMGEAAWRESERLRSLEYARAHRAERRASAKVIMARLYKQDPKRFVQRSHEHEKRLLATSPTLVRLSQAARRAAYAVRQVGTKSERGLTGVVRRIWDRAAGCCEVCHTAAPLELDHILAVTSGGTNDESNLQFLCMPCNRSKGKRDFQTWLQSRPELEGVAA